MCKIGTQMINKCKSIIDDAIESLMVEIAYRMPRKIAYWAFIRIATEASVNKLSHKEMGNVTILDVIGTWK